MFLTIDELENMSESDIKAMRIKYAAPQEKNAQIQHTYDSLELAISGHNPENHPLRKKAKPLER